MKTIQVYKKSDLAQPWVDKCFLARDLISRTKGLLGRDGLSPGEGMWIEPCNSIHTFFMRFPIDVLYLARNPLDSENPGAEYQVLKISSEVAPWRLHFPIWKATAVLELPAGFVASRGLQRGDVLCIKS